MSNSDSFINEVTEEVRREKLYRIMRRYGWIPALAVVLVVGTAAWLEWSKAQQRASAQAFGDAILSALETDDDAARRGALRGIETTDAQSGVLDLLIAAEALQDDRTRALDALHAASENTALPDSYRQLAALKRMIIGGADLDRDERQAVLGGLAQPGQPYRALALEQQAVMLIEEGAVADALDILRNLRSDAEATDALRRRAAQLINALGGAEDAA